MIFILYSMSTFLFICIGLLFVIFYFFCFLIFDDCANFLFCRIDLFDILAIVLCFLFHDCKSHFIYLKIYWVCN